MVFTILRFSRGDFLHYCGSSVREHTQFIHQLPDPTDFPCDAVTSVRQHSKFQATITCNLDSVYCNSSVWRSLYEIHVCHSQPSDMRRVTTCCWQAETLLQWARPASDTKIATGLRSKAVNATKPSGMKRRRSRLQRSNVCCQSARLSESIFCLYIFIPCFELWSLVCWKYKHSTHAALRILNRDLTSWRTIKDALNHEIQNLERWMFCKHVCKYIQQTFLLDIHTQRTELLVKHQLNSNLPVQQNQNTFCSFLTGDVVVTKIWGHDLSG